MLRINRRQQDAAAQAVLAGVGVAMCDTTTSERMAILLGIAFVVGAIDNTGQVRPAGEWLR